MTKLLHSADIHVDSPLRGLSADGDAPLDELRGATRRAMENLVALALEEQVDCLVIAGDLYDSDRDDFDTAIFLQRQFSRLVESGIEVVIVHGNHDAASEITRRLRPPRGVHVLAHDAPETVVLDSCGLALHGQSYAHRAVLDDLSAAYPAPMAGLANVGVLHTGLDGRPGHDPYAPCKVEGLVARGYEYWALGHVHQRDVLQVEGCTIVFPGNLQGRHAREPGPKGATLVGFEGEHVTSLEHRDLDVVRWERLVVDVSAAADPDEVCSRIVAASQRIPADGRRLHAVRVVVEGSTPAADRLVAERQQWVTQLRADLAGSSGRMWLEKVDLRVRRSSTSGGGQGEAIDAVRDALAALAADPAAQAELSLQFDQLRTRLGADLPALVAAGLPPLSHEGVAMLLAEVGSLLLAELEAL